MKKRAARPFTSIIWGGKYLFFAFLLSEIVFVKSGLEFLSLGLEFVCGQNCFCSQVWLLLHRLSSLSRLHINMNISMAWNTRGTGKQNQRNGPLCHGLL